MAEHENQPDPVDNHCQGPKSRNDVGPTDSDEYELTAKDAGWRTPTLLVCPARFVYFDPPRPRKRRDDEIERERQIKKWLESQGADGN
jgi:hypothetical protein